MSRNATMNEAAAIFYENSTESMWYRKVVQSDDSKSM